jgi:diacylglycerol kinase (ATP)
MSMYVILNPQAGSATDRLTLEKELNQLGDIVCHETHGPGEATHLAQQGVAQGFECIVAAGGDGTIHEVVCGLAEAGRCVRLGVLPLGTGNDFARSIGIPTTITEATHILAAAVTRQIDIVRVQGATTTYSINIASGGFSGVVNDHLDTNKKKFWGALAYPRAALEALTELTPYHTRLTYDNDEVFELALYNIAIANAQYAGGGIQIAPDALPNDGLLDIVMVPVLPLPELALLVPQIIRGTHTDGDRTVTRRAQKVQVQSQPAIPFNVDGERIDTSDFTFEIIPGALTVIVGPTSII